MIRFQIAITLALLFLTTSDVTTGQEIVSKNVPSFEVAVTDNPIEANPSVEKLQASLEESKQLHKDIVFIFTLLMFTNAIQCGHWAIQTKRNFWGWYIAGLFTGPLAGGTMLYRTGIDLGHEPKSNLGGCVAALAGLLIPAAGWVIWMRFLL